MVWRVSDFIRPRTFRSELQGALSAACAALHKAGVDARMVGAELRIATGGGTVLEFSAAFNAFFQHGVRRAGAVPGPTGGGDSVRVAVVLRTEAATAAAAEGWVAADVTRECAPVASAVGAQMAGNAQQQHALQARAVGKWLLSSASE